MTESIVPLKRRENLTLLLLLALLATSLSLNVALGWKVRGSVGFWTVPGGIQVGQVLRTLDVVGPDGAKTALNFVNEGRATILYVLSPTCGWCNRNQENIAAIARGTEAHYKVVGLSTTADGLQQYLLRVAPPFPVYSVDTRKPPEKVDLKVTPQTVLIGLDGKVQRVWEGAYTEGRIKDVEKFFSVRLPGLRPDAAGH